MTEQTTTTVLLGDRVRVAAQSPSGARVPRRGTLGRSLGARRFARGNSLRLLAAFFAAEECSQVCFACLINKLVLIKRV